MEAAVEYAVNNTVYRRDTWNNPIKPSEKTLEEWKSYSYPELFRQMET